MAGLLPTYSSEAEKKYPLDFCLWLHEAFDEFVADLAPAPKAPIEQLVHAVKRLGKIT
jgi:hypothetical protein